MKRNFTRFWKLVVGALCLSSAITAQAAYTPIVLTGFNADVVADGTGTATSSTSIGVDEGDYAFMARSFNTGGTSYLPDNGLITSVATAGLTYQLAAYTGNNSLRIPNVRPGQGAGTGTLTFATAQPAGDVYVLATSGSAASTLDITVNFVGGTSRTYGAQTVSDWYNGSNYAMLGLGRIQRGTTSIENNASNPRLYQLRLALNPADAGKQIESVLFNKTSTIGVLNVMGISLNPGCSGAPTAGAAAASVTSACFSSSINLSLTGASTDPGISYQWQASTNGGGLWNDISGATAATYTATGQSTATQYRAQLTCGTGPASFSTPVTVNQNSFLTCYCAPTSNGANEYIRRVTFNTLDNNSNANNGGYGNFTGNSALTTTVNQGITYALGLTVRSNNGGSQGGAWIDFNQNGNFDASEYTPIGSAGVLDPASFTVNVAIPATATLGQTRLRVRWRNGTFTSADACGSGWNGETEDYLITIAASAACAGTPSALTATASGSPVCFNAPLTLSATGVPAGVTGFSYQWQRSDAGTNSFANLGAAQAGVAYVVSQAVASDYRLVTTCTASGLSSTSSVVSVAQSNFLTCYCVASSSSVDDYIAGVSLNTLSNNTNAGSTATNGYGDFTGNSALTTTLIQGTSYPVTLRIHSNAASSAAGIWIDYDHNGTFDASEFLPGGGSGVNANAVLNSTLIVPANALSGQTRLRVRWHNGAMVGGDACSAGWNGETEDYLITIGSPMACTGTPPATTVTASASVVCQGTSFTLTAAGIDINATGISYQWQSSPAGANTFANLGAPQPSPTYTVATQTAATDYRALVTCSNSGLSNPSSIASVAQTSYLACYCLPVSTGAGEYIRSVSVNGASGFTNATNANSSNGFGDFTGNTALTTSLNAGSTYPIGLIVRSNNGGSQGGLWIDYDHSGAFETSEYTPIGTAGTLDPASFSISLAIPSTALGGQTRMRVRWRNGTIATSEACVTGAGNWFGETEDYLLTLVAAPLPVELVSFTATAEGPAAVRLAWATASEKNSARFEMERSTDGRSFERLGAVAAQGGTSRRTEYAYLDTQAAGKAATSRYYRLRQVDLDGTFSYSPVRTVQLGRATALALYPNPAHGTLAVAGAAAGALVEVYDALGRPVLAVAADATGAAQLILPAHLPAGLYIVRSGSQASRLTVE